MKLAMRRENRLKCPKFPLCLPISTNPENIIGRSEPEKNENEMDEICPSLWLGSLVHPKDLRNLGFTHVVSVISDRELYPSDTLDYTSLCVKRIVIDDHSDSPIADYFPECSEFIRNALLSGGKIYVHCQMGRSRSPTIVIAYLMRYGLSLEKEEQMSYRNAYEYVRSKRWNICPNLGFVISLRNYESKL